MEFRQVGSSDLRVSVAGLGCNNFGGRQDAAESRRVIDRALERGVNFLDTADSYGNDSGSEKVLGEVLGARRKDVVLATKFGWKLDDTRQGASRAYVFSAAEASLTRLKTDWIDLYQLHQPDPKTPIEETLGALQDLVRQGKVRYVGCSNLSAAQLVEARRAADAMGISGFISTQDEYSLLARGVEAELIPELNRLGMSFIPYSPLAGGFLSGKYRRGEPMPADGRLTKSQRVADRYLNDANWRIVEALTAFAAARGHTVLELAIAWLKTRAPVCSVIAGAMTPEQVDANMAAMSWDLSPTEIAEIDRITG